SCELPSTMCGGGSPAERVARSTTDERRCNVWRWFVVAGPGGASRCLGATGSGTGARSASGASRKHASSPWPKDLGDARLIGEVDPFTEKQSRISRVDDLLVARLGGEERRPHCDEPCFDRRAMRGRIRRGLDLAAIGGRNASLDGQGSPLRRRPGEAVVP